jgi:hypothetical protein
MTKSFYAFFLLITTCICFATSLYAQKSGFREGYVITVYNDTIRGLILNNSEEEITFKDSQNNKKTFYPGDLKGFRRCNMEFITFSVPGDTALLFIAHLLYGTIDLFGTIIPDNTSGAAPMGLVGGALGGLIGAVEGGAIGEAGSGLRGNDCKDDYYSIGAFYLRKGSSDSLRKVPNGRKKFNGMMIPLMRDHLDVVRSIPDEMFFTGNTISIVRQYNAAAGNPQKTN